jgi:pimeloyl-ACP methyl ester carboxylesterase
MRWLALSGFLLLAALVFVALSLTGRGARDATGKRRAAQSDGKKIVFYDESGGEGVVMLASWARPVSDFNEVAGALHRAGFRTLGIESRGIGGSGGGGRSARPTLEDLAGDVAAVLDAAGVAPEEPVHVVGHAFGNRVARTFATLYPARTRSVTLVAAGGRATVPARLTRALFVSSLTFLPWSRREPAVRGAFFAKGNEIPRYWRLGWSLWGGLGQDHAARSGDGASFWAAGGARMLVFQAEQDTIAPPKVAGIALREDFPDRVKLVMVPDAGHALLPEQPELIAEGIVEFLHESGPEGR